MSLPTQCPADLNNSLAGIVFDFGTLQSEMETAKAATATREQTSILNQTDWKQARRTEKSAWSKQGLTALKIRSELVALGLLSRYPQFYDMSKSTHERLDDGVVSPEVSRDLLKIGMASHAKKEIVESAV